MHTDLRFYAKRSNYLMENNETSVLPPDGKLIYITPWRREIAGACLLLLGLMNLSLGITALLLGKPAGILLGLFSFAMAAFSIRAAMGGLMLEQSGVKLRTPVWTYRWEWSEVECFELKPRGYTPRLRIHLRSGRVKKVRGGFFAGTPSEEKRCQAFFRALEARLEREQRRPPAADSPQGSAP